MVFDHVVGVLRETGTIWENYAPVGAARGRPAKRDFVGWSGLAPITFLLEHAIGLRPDAPGGRLEWRIASPRRVGVERFRFGGRTVSLVCEEAGDDGHRQLRVESDGAFRLVVHHGGREHGFEVRPGEPLERGL